MFSRILVLTSVLVGLTGCSAAEKLVGAQTGDLVFRLDAQSCAGVAPLGLEFFVDGKSKGTASLAPGGSKSYSVDTGQRSIGARVSNIDYQWPTSNATVPAGSSFTWTMVCT